MGKQVPLQQTPLQQPPLHGTWPLGQVQTPPAQIWPPVHRVPQAPQLLASVARLAQAPPQTTWPVGQWHFPLSQVAPAGQTLAHLPQLLGSVWMLTQLPLQFVEPLLQVNPQDAFLQIPVAPAGAAQTLPQNPQFFGSLVVSEQPVMQHCCVPMQGGPPLHPPPLQTPEGRGVQGNAGVEHAGRGAREPAALQRLQGQPRGHTAKQLGGHGNVALAIPQ